MVRLNEIRIGNIIAIDGKRVFVSMIDENGVNGIYADSYRVMPIPIEDAISIEQLLDVQSYSLGFGYQDGRLSAYYNHEDLEIPLRYVHELQNVISMLGGEDYPMVSTNLADLQHK